MKTLLALCALGFFAYVPAPLTVPENSVESVELNTFGPLDGPRTVLIYRDADRSIVDWRWLSCDQQIPQRVRPGRYLAVWNDAGKPRIVYCRRVYRTRTRDDIELAERAVLPESKRRRLW